MLVADLRHFLDMPDGTPGSAHRLAEHLGDVVRAATAGEVGPPWVSALRCCRRPGNRRCPGRVIVSRADPSAEIEWSCSVCGDAGRISGWQDSPFDLRARRLTVAGTFKQVVLSDEVAATLRELRLFDPDCERVVFRARAYPQGMVVLPADEDDLDELIGLVAAEANHEANRPRQQRLDAAFDALNEAAANLGS